MKINIGRIIILVSMLVTGILWWFATPNETISVLDQWSHLLAGLSLTGLSLVFVLSMRNQRIERWFGGLDSVYKDHKWLAIVSVVLIFIHGRMSESIAEAEAVGQVEKSLSAILGTFGQFLFIGLVLVALFAKKMKYENWRLLHRLMVIPYIMGIYHTYVSSKYDLFAIRPLSVLVGLTTIIGVAAGIYTILFYQNIGFKHNGCVTHIEYLNGSTLEIELTLDQSMDFSSGQYVFIKVLQKGLDKSPHPYTIARGKGNKIYLAIKKLGDDTSEMYDKLTKGAKVKLSGPFGQFDFEKGRDKQVWIAGGIGITAFTSYLEKEKIDREIDLFYTYRGEDQGVYRRFFEEYEEKHKGFKVHFHDTSNQERLELNSEQVEGNVSVYICGPGKMINQYSKSIKILNKSADINFEEFGFSR